MTGAVDCRAPISASGGIKGNASPKCASLVPVAATGRYRWSQCQDRKSWHRYHSRVSVSGLPTTTEMPSALNASGETDRSSRSVEDGPRAKPEMLSLP